MARRNGADDRKRRFANRRGYLGAGRPCVERFQRVPELPVDLGNGNTNILNLGGDFRRRVTPGSCRLLLQFTKPPQLRAPERFQV